MTRFGIAAVLAVVLGLGVAEKASAQIVYGYSVPNARGVVNGGLVISPGAYQSYNSFYSPYTGLTTQQSYGMNIFGQSYGQAFGYNPFTGLGFNTGFYQPGYFYNPYAGMGYSYPYGMVYGFYGRRW